MPAAGPHPAFVELTERESQVVVSVAKGLSNADIARQMFVSEATVKTHLNRAMAKLGLSSRAQVVAAAYEAGLVTPGSRTMAKP